MKVAAVCTHPIQYYSPWFKALAARIDLKVYYALQPDQHQQSVGFGGAFSWDVPLLEGYDWELLPNTRANPSLRGFLRSSTPAIYSRLARWIPDAVIITGWQALPLIQANVAAMRLGIPRVLRGESNSLRRRPPLVRLIHRAMLSSFDAVLTIGELNRQFYRDYGISQQRLFRSPYFVDNDRFQRQLSEVATERDSIRAGWQIPSGKTCFLFAGKLEPKKRILDLLNALKIATSRSTSIHLLVAGTGEQMDEALALVATANLPVTFAGFLNQTEITRAYSAADCLVLPSDYGETWGLVVNEAMACGLPAIVSDRVGCGPDLIEEGVTGAVFPFADVEALAARLVEFSTSTNTLREMGERARKRVAGYSVDAAVEGTLNALAYVTKDARRTTVERGLFTES
jgi:glycosyltransferase involved in cell wall biosynthesis